MPIANLPPPNKRLGQNFLIDPNIVRKIVSLAQLDPNDHVLEIGPGRGFLTEALCQAAGRITAVEVDPRLHAYLETRRAELPNVELVCEDALTYPVESLPTGTVVVANLPYYISTPLLFRLLDQRDRFPRMVLMLQNEVVDRLVAKPGGSDYGVLSVMAQYAAVMTKAFRVSAQCFRPRPDVGSAVVLLRAKDRTRLNHAGRSRVSRTREGGLSRIGERRSSIPCETKGTHLILLTRHCSDSILPRLAVQRRCRSKSSFSLLLRCPSSTALSQGWGLIDLPLRASNGCLFIWSISSIWFVWLIGLEIHSEEPDRPERPANQTDEPERVARAQKIIRLHPLLSFELINPLCQHRGSWLSPHRPSGARPAAPLPPHHTSSEK